MSIRLAVLLCCCLAWGSVAALAGAGSAAAAPASAAPASGSSSGVTVWLPYWEMPSALATTLDNAGVIRTASPYWYAIAGDSTVEDQHGAGSPSTVAALRDRDLQVVPMVTETASMRAFERIIASPARRAALVRTLVQIASRNGYAGLDLDFEDFAYDPGHQRAPADRIAQLYPVLIAQACRALHAIGRSCQVAVMARTTSAHVYAHADIATWVYDYHALARVADRVQIMAYDYHSPGGPAGPIAPLPWVRAVLAYARSQGQPARFELGVPAYGYDWYGPTSATAVYARQVPRLLAQVHARPHWSAKEGEETFTYRSGGHRRVVWFDDAAAEVVRARLAVSAGFSGIAVWAAGYEQAGVWRRLQSVL